MSMKSLREALAESLGRDISKDTKETPKEITPSKEAHKEPKEAGAPREARPEGRREYGRSGPRDRDAAGGGDRGERSGGRPEYRGHGRSSRPGAPGSYSPGAGRSAGYTPGVRRAKGTPVKKGVQGLIGYEATFIFSPDVTEELEKNFVEKLKGIIGNHNGTLVLSESWGRKRLAYPIQKETRGLYQHMVFGGDNKLVAELERNMRINEKVMRFLTVKLSDDFNAAEYKRRPAYGQTAGPVMDKIPEKRDNPVVTPQTAAAAPQAEPAPQAESAES